MNKKKFKDFFNLKTIGFVLFRGIIPLLLFMPVFDLLFDLGLTFGLPLIVFCILYFIFIILISLCFKFDKDSLYVVLNFIATFFYSTFVFMGFLLLIGRDISVDFMGWLFLYGVFINLAVAGIHFVLCMFVDIVLFHLRRRFNF